MSEVNEEEEDQGAYNKLQAGAEGANATAVEEKRLIEESVKIYRNSRINAAKKALLEQGAPGDKNYKEPVHPVPYISKLSQTGLMEITLSHEIHTVSSTSLITNGTIEIN